MNSSDKRKETAWLTTGSTVFLAAVALGVVLLYTRTVLIPFVLALFIVALISPILDFQVLRLKLPRPVAATVTFLFVIVMIVVMVLIVIQSVQTIISTADQYSESIAALTQDALDRISEYGLDLRSQEITSEIKKTISVFVRDSIGSAFGFVSQAMFVLIFILFMLIGRNPRMIRTGIYADIDHQVRRYIGIKLTASMVTGFLVYICLSAINLELARLFGILAFFLNFIPSIGSIVSTLLPIPIAAGQFQNPWLIAYVALVPGAIQLAIGNLIEPRFQGKELDLHPITVLMALFFWGLLWGIPGMFLAIPMTAVIRIIIMQFDTLKPVADILAGHLPESKGSNRFPAPR